MVCFVYFCFVFTLFCFLPSWNFGQKEILNVDTSHIEMYYFYILKICNLVVLRCQKKYLN